MDKKRGKELQEMAETLLNTRQQDDKEEKLADDINETDDILDDMVRALKYVDIDGKFDKYGYDNIFTNWCELE